MRNLRENPEAEHIYGLDGTPTVWIIDRSDTNVDAVIRDDSDDDDDLNAVTNADGKDAAVRSILRKAMVVERMVKQIKFNVGKDGSNIDNGRRL